LILFLMKNSNSVFTMFNPAGTHRYRSWFRYAVSAAALTLLTPNIAVGTHASQKRF